MPPSRKFTKLRRLRDAPRRWRSGSRGADHVRARPEEHRGPQRDQPRARFRQHDGSRSRIRREGGAHALHGPRGGLAPDRPGNRGGGREENQDCTARLRFRGTYRDRQNFTLRRPWGTICRTGLPDRERHGCRDPP